jgi:hypothetical protein
LASSATDYLVITSLTAFIGRFEMGIYPAWHTAILCSFRSSFVSSRPCSPALLKTFGFPCPSSLLEELFALPLFSFSSLPKVYLLDAVSLDRNACLSGNVIASTCQAAANPMAGHIIWVLCIPRPS